LCSGGCVGGEVDLVKVKAAQRDVDVPVTAYL
jgi:hypothetical protein